MSATITPVPTSRRPAFERPTLRVPMLWVGFVVASLLALDLVGQTTWAIAVPVTAAALWLGTTRPWRAARTWRPPVIDRRDLAVVAGLYVAVVGQWRLAYTLFTADPWLA